MSQMPSSVLQSRRLEILLAVAAAGLVSGSGGDGAAALLPSVCHLCRDPSGPCHLCQKTQMAGACSGRG